MQRSKADPGQAATPTLSYFLLMSSIFSSASKTSLRRLCLTGSRNLALAGGLLAGPAAWAQAPTWQSAYLAGGGAYSQVTAITTDASGNVYVAGFFSNPTLRLSDITLTNAVTSGSQVGFSRDAFVAKWSPVTQRFVWAQRAGGSTNGDIATAIVASGTNIYVLATLSGATVGGIAVPEGDNLLKFDNAGNVQWVQPTGLVANGLTANGNSVYVAGSFTGTTNIGGFSLTSAGGNDLAVAKLTDTGSSSSYVWAQRVGGPGHDGAGPLTVQGSTVYMATSYGVSASFGPVQTTGDGFGVAKLVDAGSSGSFSWMQPTGGFVRQLAVGNGGRLYAAGSFNGTATFGTTTLRSIGSTSSFVAALTDGGSAASWGWAQQSDYADILSVAATGTSVYIAGLQGTATSIGTIALPTPTGSGIYVAKLTDTGSASSYAWAVSASATFTTPAYLLAVSGTTVYLTGMLAGPVSFGSITQPASGGPVAFLAQLNDGATALAAASSTAPTELAVTPNPARAAATVQLPPGAAKGEATLTLLDAQGRAVRTQAVRAGTPATLDLVGVMPGLYLVRIKAGETQVVRRLLVE